MDVLIYFSIIMIISMIDPINIICYTLAGLFSKNIKQAAIGGTIATIAMLILVVIIAQREISPLDFLAKFTGTLLGTLAVFYTKKALKKSRDDNATIIENTAVTNEKNEENRDRTSS